MNVALFSGGRGSTVLSKRLIREPNISLTVLVNGYDDGKSTGEVRRYLGDSLGPSDFRKNASRFAKELNSCEPELIKLLDFRLPLDMSISDGEATIRAMAKSKIADIDPDVNSLKQICLGLSNTIVAQVGERLQQFLSVYNTGSFTFSDCAIGNMVFAGCHLQEERDFNRAVENYNSLLGLPSDLIINVTGGENLYLVALDKQAHFLGSEEDIVDSAKKNQIEEIYLLNTVFGVDERLEIAKWGKEEIVEKLEALNQVPLANPVALEALKNADLIIYSPGTQHSSLFPSYLTPGIGEVIANNYAAIKLLITNIHEDAEIPDFDAVKIARRAIFYLREKDKKEYSAPLLVTHSLFNFPGNRKTETAYIDPGNLGLIQDPRLIRVGDYEDGISGFHDADKALTPFIQTILRREKRLNIGVVMQGADSRDKIIQSVLQMVRYAETESLIDIDIISEYVSPLPESLHACLPFTIRQCPVSQLQPFLLASDYDYVVLFDSSGMYHGGDVIKLISVLKTCDLDVVWGSRRLSVNDIHDSYLLRYRKKWGMGAVSYLGSHLLSLMYLFLFNRYISDTLSGLRVIRCETFLKISEEVTENMEQSVYNQQILASILKKRGEVLEMPVRFSSQSPKMVKRTTFIDGLTALGVILKKRLLG